eukprot:NODE_883_length_1325_cov_345.186614.p2 GENE.NODE_883_length_1325_cov_345.186614~~NODE_883_length_1325_cov_345.186614.p2  ORF type:complete len:165 (+),score=66.85 NODE_883_length_1325_cov_345.186614:3-497(+)
MGEVANELETGYKDATHNKVKTWHREMKADWAKEQQEKAKETKKEGDPTSLQKRSEEVSWLVLKKADEMKKYQEIMAKKFTDLGMTPPGADALWQGGDLEDKDPQALARAVDPVTMVRSHIAHYHDEAERRGVYYPFPSQGPRQYDINQDQRQQLMTFSEVLRS